MAVLMYPGVAPALVALWGVCVYAIVRRNEKIERLPQAHMPLAFLALVFVASMLALFTLPTPWNISVAIATVGFGLAAYSDFKTGDLWDEAIVSTTFLCGGVMILGRQGAASIAGGILCGTLASVLYFTGLIFGKETGYGDVKLAAGIGFALGPVGGVAAYIIGALVMAVGVLVWAAVKKKTFSEARRMPVPFGPALTGGMLTAAAMLPHVGSFR
jgi:prepilin signal peptidase PulO-like enzyme (type II secretory pathway)